MNWDIYLKIHLQADPPEPSKIREEDIIGVTVLLLTCSYVGQEFIRVGYYVNNDYDDEQLKEEPPQKVLVDRIQRNILVDKPRVTKFPINFHPENNDNEEQAPPPDNATAEDVLEKEPVSLPNQCNEQCPQTWETTSNTISLAVKKSPFRAGYFNDAIYKSTV